MIDVNIKTIEQLAKLARIGIDESEKESLLKDLSSILGFVAKLGEVDVTNVKPTNYAVELSNVIRNDVMNQYDKQSDLVNAAPAQKDNLVKVKAVFE